MPKYPGHLRSTGAASLRKLIMDWKSGTVRLRKVSINPSQELRLNCDHLHLCYSYVIYPLSVCLLITLYPFFFLQILGKLHTKQVLMKLITQFVFSDGTSTKMAALAFHWLTHFDSSSTNAAWILMKLWQLLSAQHPQFLNCLCQV